jgi:multicomponent Na+:H+ antiporter subunit E
MSVNRKATIEKTTIEKTTLRSAPMPPYRIRAFFARLMLFFGFWLLLLEPGSLALAEVGAGLGVGALAAVAATLLSLRLLPPTRRGPRPWPMLRFLLRFVVQSMRSGVDVARLALDPRLPLAPGLSRQPTTLPDGTSRALFGVLMGQVPGTMTVGAGEHDHLLIHCLHRDRDVAGAYAVDEALFRRMLGDDGGAGGEPAAR